MDPVMEKRALGWALRNANQNSATKLALQECCHGQDGRESKPNTQNWRNQACTTKTPVPELGRFATPPPCHDTHGASGCTLSQTTEKFTLVTSKSQHGMKTDSLHLTSRHCPVHLMVEANLNPESQEQGNLGNDNFGFPATQVQDDTGRI